MDEKPGAVDHADGGRTAADRAPPGRRGLAEGVGVDLAGGQPLERGEYTHSTETDLEHARVPPGIDDQGDPNVVIAPAGGAGSRPGGDLSIEGHPGGAGDGHSDGSSGEGHPDGGGEGHPNGGATADGHPR